MEKTPEWFNEAYEELTTTLPGEVLLVEETFPSIDEVITRLRSLGDFIQPNVLKNEGKPIAEDPQVPTPAWVCEQLGDKGEHFQTLPIRAQVALDTTLDNRRRQMKDLPFTEDTAWRRRASMNNFAHHFDPVEVAGIASMFDEFDYQNTRLPLATSLSCWPLRVRTVGDVHRGFNDSLEKMGLVEEFNRLSALRYPNPEGVNFNAAAQRAFFPVMIDMLCKGYSLYPALIA